MPMELQIFGLWVCMMKNAVVLILQLNGILVGPHVHLAQVVSPQFSMVQSILAVVLPCVQ